MHAHKVAMHRILDIYVQFNTAHHDRADGFVFNLPGPWSKGKHLTAQKVSYILAECYVCMREVA
jgi:hypothetical protein